jgi:ERCC4-type nuclease
MIHVSIDSNESIRPRADLIREAVQKDEHFKEIPPIEPLPFDLEFWAEDNIENAIHVELKDFSEAGNSDYLSSILSGHLWNQVLAAREMGEPLIIAVLGDDQDIAKAIASSVSKRGLRGPSAADTFSQTMNRVNGFEAKCFANNIPVLRMKLNSFARILLLVKEILLDRRDLTGFAPKPADGERQAVGLSILAGRGVGPKMAANILQRYNLCLVLKDGFCGDLVDCTGIGPKRAEMIRKNLEVLD